MAGNLVQSAMVNTTGATSLSVAFPVNNTAGNAIAVFAGDGGGSGSTLTITDTLNTYGANLDTVNEATDGTTTITNAKTGIAGGANTVKVSNALTHQMGLCIAEISGVGAVDGHTAQAQFGVTSLTSGNATNGATAFGVGFSWILGATVTPPAAGTGWTSSAGTNITVTTTSFGNGTPGTGGCRLEWQPSLASGSHAATFTAASSDFTTAILMFDETGGASTVGWPRPLQRFPGRSPGPQSARFYQSPKATNALFTKSMEGVSTATTAAAGNLLGTGTLSGASVASTAAVGNLLGTGVLAGVSVSTSAATGALLATGVLSGVSVAFTVGVGDLQPFAGNVLSGVSIATTYGVGNLQASGVLSGTAVSTTEGVGNLLGTGTLAGISIATSAAVGNLTGGGVLSGVSITTSQGVGNLAGTGVLSGVSVSSTFAIGDLQPFSAGSIAGVSVASSYGVGELSSTFTPPSVSAQAGGRRRVREIYRLKIDGHTFEFRSLAEAVELLNRLKALAREKARQTIDSAVKTSQKPSIPRLPEIQINSRDLRATVAEVKRDIQQIYEGAARDAEIALLLEIQARNEHNEEALILLW